MDTLSKRYEPTFEYAYTEPPTVLCGNERLSENLTEVLYKLRANQEQISHILVDYPRGWVLLEQDISFETCLIASDNPCSDYLQMLLELSPFSLVTTLSDYTIASALIRGYKITPDITPKLSPSERHTLKLVADGYTNKQIAQKRNTSTGVVENCLSVIYRKLSLKTRIDLAHYFFGNWHLLPKTAWNQETKTG